MPAFRPWLIILLGVTLIVLALITASTSRLITSDYVAQQNITNTLSLRSRPIVDMQQDNFIIKLPIYVLTERLPVAPLPRLVATSVIINALSILLFFWSLQRFGRLFNLSRSAWYVPFLWVCSASAGLAAVLLNPNTRNLEIGLGFAALACLATWYKDEWQADTLRRKELGAAFVLGLGLLFYDDPYTIYVVGLPLVAVFGLTWLLRTKEQHRDLQMVLVVVAAYIAAKVWYWLLWALGFHAAAAYGFFAPVSQLGPNMSLVGSGLLMLFGASIFGQPVASVQSFGLELNLVILLITTVLPLLLLFSKRIRQDVWKVFLVLLPFFALLACTVSGIMSDFAPGSIRYLVFVPFTTATIFLVLMGEKLPRRAQIALASIFLLAAALNTASTAYAYAHRGDSPNAMNEQIAAVLKSHGLTKGYAAYWDAGIDQYLTNNKTIIIQAGCSPTVGIDAYRFLVNEQEYALPATESFYLYNPGLTRCSSSDMERFLGKPKSSVMLPGRLTLYIYGYDISSRIHR